MGEDKSYGPQLDCPSIVLHLFAICISFFLRLFATCISFVGSLYFCCSGTLHSSGNPDCRNHHPPRLLVGQDQTWELLRLGSYQAGQGGLLTFPHGLKPVAIRMFTLDELLWKMEEPWSIQSVFLPLVLWTGTWPSPARSYFLNGMMMKRYISHRQQAMIHFFWCMEVGKKDGFCWVHSQFSHSSHPPHPYLCSATPTITCSNHQRHFVCNHQAKTPSTLFWEIEWPSNSTQSILIKLTQ